MGRFDKPAEPYPPPGPGTKARMLDGPVDPPSPPDEPELAERTDGTKVNWRRTVAGLSADPRSPDDNVHDWRDALWGRGL
jgi:hypothetical protein